MARYSPALAAVLDQIESPGGWSDIDARLEQLYSSGEKDSVFAVWDQDVLASANGMPAKFLVDHSPSHTFPRDFEELFPDWMVAEALDVYDTSVDYPGACEIRDARRSKGSEQPFYERLCACVKNRASANGLDPTAIAIPSKSELAQCLAQVANRTWYQPEEIRRLLDHLREWIGKGETSNSLIGDRVSVTGYILNSQLINGAKLHGTLALAVLPDLWLIDLDELNLKKVVSELVTGAPCWSDDGSRIAFPSKPTHTVYNSEAIRVYDLDTGIGPERLRMGRTLCWGKDGRIYGNSLGWELVCSLDPKSGDRRNLPLPRGSIVACVDRHRNLILIGEQGRRPGRICSIFRTNDGHRVWDGATANLPIAEYGAGAFSPNGRIITWPVEDQGGIERTSLWATHVDSAATASVRLTPSDGRVMSSTWSPDSAQVAFMWSRWGGDPVRVWIVDMASRQLEPLVEGPLDLGALGCHSWTHARI